MTLVEARHVIEEVFHDIYENIEEGCNQYEVVNSQSGRCEGQGL